MSQLPTLLLMAVRALPEEEQNAILLELLTARLEAPAQASAPAGFGVPPATGVRLAELLGSVASVPMERDVSGPLQTVPVRLPTPQYERLKQWCQSNNFTMAVVLRGLVARFLDAQDHRARPGGEPE